MKVAIIGAGITGSFLASLLKKHADVQVFEKARGVGGRLATRYADPYFFDHGAPYFTMTQEATAAYIAPLITQKIIQAWYPKFALYKGSQCLAMQRSEEAHYLGSPGMNAICKHLLQDITVHLNTSISAINHQNTWTLYDDKQNQMSGFDSVIITTPPQQAAALLPSTAAPFDAISEVEMSACATVMLGLQKDLAVAFDVAKIQESILSQVILNHRKPARSSGFSVVIHATPEYAHMNRDQDRSWIGRQLCQSASECLGEDLLAAQYNSVHFWRMAQAKPGTKPGIMAAKDTKVMVAADWCLGGGIERALQAAYQAYATFTAQF